MKDLALAAELELVELELAELKLAELKLHPFRYFLERRQGKNNEQDKTRW